MSETSPSTASSPAWQALIERLQQQNWPQPALYVVATPIGNLTDLSLRAWYALRLADVIAAEDTRTSQPLLQAWRIDTSLMSAHRHNERAATAVILDRLAQGQRVALISDAGAPAVSDPGGQLVQDVREAGFEVIPIPGANAAISALMATGATTDALPMFSFLGFLPARQAARERMLGRWLGAQAALVMYEAPHRIRELVADLCQVFGTTRRVSLARELTKRFEETVTLELGEAAAWVESDPHREQGEYVVILHPQADDRAQDTETDPQWETQQRQAWMAALLSELSTRDAARIMAKALGLPKDICYAQLLAHSRGRNAGSNAE